jgi:hypothetical protein
LPHDGKTASTATYNFNPSLTTAMTTTATTTSTTRASSVGIAYGSYSSGSFNLKWTDTQLYDDFVLTLTGASSNSYAAVGFSNNGDMVTIHFLLNFSHLLIS